MRDAGITAPMRAWLTVPDAQYGRAINENIDLTVHSIDQLHEIAHAAANSGHTSHVHLKVDTGTVRDQPSPPREREAYHGNWS